MEPMRHTLTLRGEGCHGRRARPEVVGGVLTLLKPTVRDTVRMGFLRSSRRAGRPLEELRAAWNIQFLGQTRGPGGATVLHFEAPSFGAAAPRLFRQNVLWDDAPARHDTAFDLVGDVLQDVANRAVDSERYDTHLLKQLAAFDRALRRGLDVIEVAGHRIATDRLPSISREVTQAARALALDTPPPKRVRVQGKLDMIRVSDRVFELILRDTGRVRAVWTQSSIVPLRDYLNRQVLIEGEAVFRPSGGLLRIDTEAIAPSGEKDAFFSVLPTCGRTALRKGDILQPQTPSTGAGAIFGRWPGEETEDELLAAIEEIG